MSASANAKENCLGWAARDASGFLSPFRFSRRVPGSDDVSLRITHCGVCFADVACTRNKIGDSVYPLVPGHEIVGIVTEVGSAVSRFKVGDHVGVGTYVGSCRACEFLTTSRIVTEPVSMINNHTKFKDGLGVQERFLSSWDEA